MSENNIQVKRINPNSRDRVTFRDVHGCDEAKEELQEIVEFLRDPYKFTRNGGKLPKGVLLYGPPGTGKTLMAKAIAGEADVPFFQMSGSEFDEVFVGVGSKRMRQLFKSALKSTPAIIFIDELDAVGARRNDMEGRYSSQTLNQLLSELDGFTSSDGIIFIGATNYRDRIDSALLRPGRIDKQINVPPPDVTGRVQILDFYLKKIKMRQRNFKQFIQRCG